MPEVKPSKKRSKENTYLIIGFIAIFAVAVITQIWRDVLRHPRHELYQHTVDMFYTSDHHIVYEGPHGNFWWLDSASDDHGLIGTITTNGVIVGNWIRGRPLSDGEQSASTMIHQTITLDEEGDPSNSTLPFRHKAYSKQ